MATKIDILSSDELFELTQRKRKADQIGWLKRERIPYLVGANGHPRVSRDCVLARLGATGANATVDRPSPEPNFNALRPGTR